MITSGFSSIDVSMCTVSDAKLTEAFTPSISLRVLSIEFTQDEHVMPDTEYV